MNRDEPFPPSSRPTRGVGLRIGRTFAILAATGTVAVVAGFVVHPTNWLFVILLGAGTFLLVTALAAAWRDWQFAFVIAIGAAMVVAALATQGPTWLVELVLAVGALLSLAAVASRWPDRLFASITATGALLVLVALALLVVVLFSAAWMSIQHFGVRFLTNPIWQEPTSRVPGNVYGIVPMATGTLITSALALLFAVPLSLGTAIFLTQQAPRWLREPVSQLVELLAAIPSVIYGFWGLIVLVPLMRTVIEPLIYNYLYWTGLFQGPITGLDFLTASIVLAVMVIPTITAISREAISAVPTHQKEAALSLGATDWEVTRNAVLPYARAGVFAGVVLGLGRALGETMAVLLLLGNTNQIPHSFFAQGQTIASLLGNQFFEASGPLEHAALVEAGLILLVITLAVNVGARLVFGRLQRGVGVGRE
jgi:phosphate transport system permease protein